MTRRPTRTTRPAKPKAAKPKAKPAPRKPICVHTCSPLPPRREFSPAIAEANQAALASLLSARGIHLSPASPAFPGEEWWQSALAARDEAQIARQAAAIATNNHFVAATANGLDLDVHPVYDTGILQFDALAMAKRIEQAAAKHARKRLNQGRAKGANRHLKFECPKCGLPARASHPDRIMMCAGRYDAQHELTLMAFDPTSQPEYRHVDDAAGTAIAPEATPLDTYDDKALHFGQYSRSQSQLAANAKRLAAKLAAEASPETPKEHLDIPF